MDNNKKQNTKSSLEILKSSEPRSPLLVDDDDDFDDDDREDPKTLKGKRGPHSPTSGPRKTNIIDLTDVRQEIEGIRIEAVAYGVTLEFDTLKEYQEAILKLRKDRRHKPPCYQKSFDDAAPECRICEIRRVCSRKYHLKDLAMHELYPVECKKCMIGQFKIEAKDRDDNIIDYGCTTVGCAQTLKEQVKGWRPVKKYEKKEVKTKKTEEVIKLQIVRFLANRTDWTRRELIERNVGEYWKPIVKQMITMVLMKMVDDGILEQRINEGYMMKKTSYLREL